MTEQQAMRMALEAMIANNKAWKHLADSGDAGFWEAEEQAYYQLNEKAITVLRQALEQAEMVQSIEAKLAYKEWCKSNNWISFPEWISKQQPVERTADEPVAFVDEGLGTFYWPKEYKKDVGFTPLYTRPQPAAWVSLTDEEIQEIALELPMDAVRIAEATLRSKNT